MDPKLDPKWTSFKPASELTLTFAYGEVRFKLSHDSFHALRSLETLKTGAPQKDQGVFGFIAESQPNYISLNLPQLLKQEQTPQSEPTLSDLSEVIGDRWVLGWSGPEWDEIEPRLILTRGPLTQRVSRHGIIGELVKGRNVLSRLGIGDRVLKIELR